MSFPYNSFFICFDRNLHGKILKNQTKKKQTIGSRRLRLQQSKFVIGINLFVNSFVLFIEN